MQKHITVLKRIEAENEEQNLWIVGPETGKLLNWLVKVWRPEVILEIGTSVGYSAIWMAEALEANGKGKLYTIESHLSRFEAAQKNIEGLGFADRIVQFQGHAPEIFYEDGDLPAEIDFAFFDATKKEHSQFFEAVYPRMKSGGLIVIDNVLSHRFGEMKKFIEFMQKHPNLDVIEVPVGDGLLLAKLL